MFPGIILQAYAKNQLNTYPAPKGAELNNDFTVKVRQPGKAWFDIDIYNVKVHETGEVESRIADASLGYFDFSGEVEVAVTFNHGSIETSRVRPLSYEITPEISDNTLTFTLDQPRNLSIEVNGDIFHNLHLFANPIEAYKPDPKDPDIIYYAPGLHQPKGGGNKDSFRKDTLSGWRCSVGSSCSC